MIQDLSSDYKVEELAKAGYSSRGIARQLGMNHRYIQQLLKNKNIKAGDNDDGIVLTNTTAKLRIELGGILTDLYHTVDNISELTGLNKREIFNAMNRPWRHDWTLSQIERTLAHDPRKRMFHEII